jgi:hypothetical protein
VKISVISVICVCILIVSCSVFLNWACWARGNFLASRVTYIFGCLSLRCVECRAGTSIFGHFAGVGGGTVRIFYSPWLRFGVFGTIDMVGVAGQYGFSSFPGSVLAGTVRLKWQGCAVISFSFSLVSCHYSWRVDMRGRDIALNFLWYFVVFSCGFLYSSC